VTAVTFIIPARNEVALVGEAVANIRQFAPPGVAWELLIVDNGSTDGTFEAAAAFADVRALRSTGTVGAARNTAVAAARGTTLVFLDADVRLTQRWQREIGRVLADLQTSPRLITGSTVTIPPSPGLIERHWFYPATLQRRQYINSGHLIVTRAFFDEVLGFDPALRTGEDFDFCRRARLAGGTVRDDRALEAVHLGFPQTLGAFARRELWHGQGDGGSLRNILRSRVACLSVLVAALTIGGPLLSIATRSALPAAVGLGGAILISLVFGVRRTGRPNIASWLVNTGLYYVYFLCRAVALLRRSDGWRQQANQANAS
jgi:glycosyltransferase involved in cell wall biosynthesis